MKIYKSFLILFILNVLGGCKNHRKIKEEFNKSLQGYFSRDIDYTDSMSIHKINNFVFCQLSDDSLMFVSEIKDNALISGVCVLHNFPLPESYVENANLFKKFETKSGKKIVDIFYHDKYRFHCYTTFNSILSGDTILVR